MKELLIVLVVAGVSACAAGGTDLVGRTAAPQQAQRTIVISPATKYVNVANGEVVTFQIGSKAFTWRFDGSNGSAAFPLSRIAPAGALDQPVTTYVAPNPQFYE